MGTKTTTAYCYRNGVIRFRRRPGRGTLAIATGEVNRLRQVVRALARHSRDNRTLLVPGVPEAANETKACDAVIAFGRWVNSRLEGAR